MNAPAQKLAAARYTLDASHTTVSFTVRHMMITNVRGEFGSVSGEVVYDANAPERATISASIDAASIRTRDEARDNHLRSADFLDVASHPTLTFVSHRVVAKGDRYEVEGDLTIRGTKRAVVLTVEDVTTEHVDPWGNRRIGASARTKIRRSEFGLTWNNALEAGGVLVGDELTIEIDVSLIKQA